MQSIPRRKFIRQAGQAAALGYLGASGLGAAPGRIAIIASPSDAVASSAPAKWAAGELRSAIESKGASAVIAGSMGDAGDAAFAVLLGGESARLPREGFRIAPARISSKPAVRAAASDVRGYVYALTELADRVRHGADPLAALTLAATIDEQPANTVRSMTRAFVSDVEDKAWYYDKG